MIGEILKGTEISEELAHSDWRKAKASSANNGNCLKVAPLSGGRVGIRDWETPGKPPFVVRSEVWNAFIDGAKKANSTSSRATSPAPGRGFVAAASLRFRFIQPQTAATQSPISGMNLSSERCFRGDPVGGVVYMSLAAKLRHELAATIGSPGWRTALKTVPREVFLGKHSPRARWVMTERLV